MLILENILWVIPGVVFVYYYNKRRPNNIIKLSGWPYLFFLVFIAAFTWLPAKWIVVEQITYCSNISQKLTIVIISIILSIIVFFITQNKLILNFISIPINDNFYNKCVSWENKFILLTLKNNKVYIGILWKYPENPKSRFEFQTISIVPFKSGYRCESTKKIKWNINYPKYKDDFQIASMEVIIPRSEIITVGKFNKEVFKHFDS